VSVREMDDLMTRQLAVIIDDLGAQADTLAAGETVPRLLTGHFSVAGATVSSERTVMLGRDLMVSPGTLGDPRWDYVALGHIHKHQNLTPKGAYGPPIVYSGSLERIDFGEAYDPKGFCWIELQRDLTQWQFVPVKARPMIELHIDARNPTDTPNHQVSRAIQQQKGSLADSIVKVKIQLTPETSAQLSDIPIRDELVKCGVFHIAAIQREVERRDRPRLQVSPEGLTHEQLLTHYLQHSIPDADRRERLMDLGRDLMRSE
jgi:DNA repair protein SbcD/Mre11